MELYGNGIAESHLIRGAHKIAIRVGGDGIAAFENFERAAFFELHPETVQALALGSKEPFRANAEPPFAFLQLQPQCRNLYTKIKT